MLASELLAYIKVKKIYGDIENIDIQYISQDSRDIKEGTAFICIEGSQVDGREFDNLIRYEVHQSQIWLIFFVKS